MRKLFWFTAGFAAACALVMGPLWEHTAVLLLAALGLLAAVGLTAFFFKKAARGIPGFLGLALGAAFLLLLQNAYYRPLLPLEETVQTVTMTAEADSVPGQYSHSVRARLRVNGQEYTVRAYLGDGQTARAGDTLTGAFRLRLTLPGCSKAGGTYAGSGILALASPKGEIQITPGSAGWRTVPYRLAANARQTIARCFPEDAAPFAVSLLLGNTEQLPYGEETALRVSGIRHIVAVSGLHVSMLFGLVWLLCWKQPGSALLLGLPALFLFGAMAGSTPSVLRACIMAGLLLLSRLVRRAYDPLTALALAVLCLLGNNPFVIGAAGFQLSVLSVLGILLFQQPLSAYFTEKWARLPGKLSKLLSDSLSVSLSAMALSTPVSAWYFGTVSLVGVVTNLLTLWMLPIVFLGILAVCLLGPLLPQAGIWIGGVTAWPIRLILRIAETLSRLPMAALYTCSPWTAVWLALIYGLILVWVLTRKKHGRFFLSASLATLIAAAVLMSWGPRTDDCRLTVLDVGEGQSLLLQSGGKSMLIDCGGYSDEKAADAAWQMLRSQNFYRLDVLTLTHFDRDHAGGVSDFLTQLPAEQILLPGESGEMLAGTVLTEETVLPFGRGSVRFFPYSGGNSSNQNSMAILFESESCVILITGDLDLAGERRLLREYSIPKVDVLVVGHHGSKYATSEELLAAVQPETAVISVGRNNSYRPPTQEVLDRLAEAGCTVHRTDQEGTILIRR